MQGGEMWYLFDSPLSQPGPKGEHPTKKVTDLPVGSVEKRRNETRQLFVKMNGQNWLISQVPGEVDATGRKKKRLIGLNRLD